MKLAPVVSDVLLVGGGHSHVILIRMWAMQPIPGVRLTLVSEKVDTPYSGMLPGLIAGHYTEDAVHIDLARLCSWANVRFIEQQVTAIDLKSKTVAFNSLRPELGFDVLSLDTGSTPELSIPGSEKFSVPVKPVHGFYSRWQQLLSRLDEHKASSQDAKSINVGVVGSGAGGFELVTAIRHALSSDIASCHWFIRGQRALKGRPEKVSAMALQAAKDAGVVVHTEFDVIDVQTDSVHARDGRNVVLDEIVWCAAAKAPMWPKHAGLEVDQRGFVLTNAFLQSVNHEFVFATGDIGTQQATPSDKAGVFAVRQAPFLFKNIRRYLLNKPLKAYKPQTDFLSLMATGKKSAIGSRGKLSVQGVWVWRLKNGIDQKFMNRFRLLPEMQAPRNIFKVPQALLDSSSVNAEDASGAHMRCRGCGGKVGASILDSVLHEINSCSAAGVVCGLEEASDAAIFNTSEKSVVQSVDQISALCDDPYVFGRIAAVHALSDVFTSGATVHSAQVLVNLPFADVRIVKRDLKQLMAGVVDALNEDNCALIGGHTSEAADCSLGLVVNGFLEQAATERAITSGGTKARDGDCLILTKPIGTGVLLAGMMRQQAKGADVQNVLASMQQSNRMAASVLYANGAKAVTDITGFGLLGHLQRLLTPLAVGATISIDNNVDAEFNSDVKVDVHSVPLYSGAYTLAEQGVTSTLLKQNQQVLEQVDGTHNGPSAWLNLLCDPQTSGGLLAIVPVEQSDTVLSNLRQQGCESAQIIGTITQDISIRLNF